MRNLTTQEVPSRPRGESTDDDCLAAALESPSKTISTRRHMPGGEGVEGENSVIEATGPVCLKSSNDLPTEGLERSPKSKRRSTRGNPVGIENPILRQKRLEGAAVGRMADVFFTLHILELGGGRYPTYF